MNKYKTSFIAVGGQTNGKNILGAGTKQYITSDRAFRDSIKLLTFLKQSRNIKECHKFIKDNHISSDLFIKLFNHNMITDYQGDFNKSDSMKFKNSLYLETVSKSPERVLNRLSKSVMIVIGCGGIGNFMSYSLESFNPKEMILIDGDKIEESNLNRQLMFTENDIGKYKTDMLSRELKKRNSKLNIISIHRYVNKELLNDIFDNLDKDALPIGILSGDSASALIDTTKEFSKNNAPFLNIGYLNDISVIGPFYIPNKSCCPFCHNSFSIKTKHNNNRISEELMDINKRSEAPSSFINNALASSMATSDILQYMDDNLNNIKSFNARFGVDNVHFKTYTVKSSIDPDCKYCGGNQ